jgi:predicted secreted protein
VIALDEKAAGSTIGLAVGEEVEISLGENPTTGFRWRLPPAGPPDVVALVGDRLTPGQRPGQGGVRVLRLRGARAGTGRLALALGRSWQADAARTFALTLVVRKA